MPADRERREIFGAHHVSSFHRIAKLFRANLRASREQHKIGGRPNRDEGAVRPLRKRRQRVIGRLQDREPAAETEAEGFWAQRDLRTRIVRRAQHIFDQQFAFLFLLPRGLERNAKRVRMIVLKFCWQRDSFHFMPIYLDTQIIHAKRLFHRHYHVDEIQFRSAGIHQRKFATDLHLRVRSGDELNFARLFADGVAGSQRHRASGAANQGRDCCEWREARMECGAGQDE